MQRMPGKRDAVIMRKRMGGISSISMKKICLLYDKSNPCNFIRKDQGRQKMNIKIQVLIILAVLVAMLYIINKIRTKGIELKYCLLWLLLGMGIIVFAGFPPVE